MSRWLIGLCIAVLAGAATAIVTVPTSPGSFWLMALWAAWAFSVLWLVTRRPFSLLFAATLAAMFLFVVFPANEAQVFGQVSIAGNDYRGGVVPALQLAVLAQCALLAGAMAVRVLWPVPRFRRLYPRLSPGRLDVAAWAAVVIAVLAVIALTILGGASLRSFFVYTTPGGYGTFASEVTGHFGYLTAVQCAGGLALVLLPLRLSRTTAGARLAPMLPAALVTLLLLGGGQRGRFFVPALAAGLIWLKTSKRGRHPRRMAAAGLIVMVALGAVIGVAREEAASSQLTVDTVLAQPFGPGNDVFLPLAGLASTVPARVPYLHGTSYLQTVLFLVPRALWSGKPEGAIAHLTQVVDPSNSGLAIPEFGEMYANFGPAGVAIGSVLLGVLTELLSLRFARTASIRASVFIAVWGAVLLQIFIRGSVAPMLVTFAGLIAVTALVCRRRSAVLAAVPGPVPAEPVSPGLAAAGREQPPALIR